MPGKEADLVVVRGDPLVDIRRMADVEAVYKAGRVVGPATEHSLLPGIVGQPVPAVTVGG